MKLATLILAATVVLGLSASVAQAHTMRHHHHHGHHRMHHHHHMHH